MNCSELARLCVSLGAAKSESIEAEKIVLSPEFRKICEGNACGKYGKCYMCPPDIGDIHALMESIRAFPGGVLYQSIYDLEDSFDIEGMTSAAQKHMQLSQRINERVKALCRDEILHLSSGGCGLCSRCAKADGLPCRFPDKALSSMEGYGIDVYQTSASTDLKYINGQNTVTYFGVILLSEH